MKLLRGCLLLALATPAAVGVCTSDADCDDARPCNGIETCSAEGACLPGIDLCPTITQVAGTRVTASSYFNSGYVPTSLVDGNEGGAGWCSAPGDPAPSVTIDWILGVEVDAIRVRTGWSPSYDVLTASFRLHGENDEVLYDSGSVALTAGEIDLLLPAPVERAFALTMEAHSWNSDTPCLTEIAVDSALTCSEDVDCRPVSPCLGVGLCVDGACALAAGRCENFASFRSELEASSEYGVAYRAELAVDGIDATTSSWCASAADTEPSLALTLVNPQAIDLLRATFPWASYLFESLRFIVEDEQGQLLRESPPLNSYLNDPIEWRIDPPIAGASRVVLTGAPLDREPCVGEFEVLGETCSIRLFDTQPLSLAFLPDSPTPEFELRYGRLDELWDDGDFTRSFCLGSHHAPGIELFLADPLPGEGFYFLARGLDVCLGEGFGRSHASPDPRAVLAATAACP